MDLIQIKTNLDLFSVQYDQDESEMIRNVLKKYLLTEILKSPEHANSDFLKTCLNETDLALNSRKQLGYLCVFVGCKYQGSRHHRYVMHVKKACLIMMNINVAVMTILENMKKYESMSFAPHWVNLVGWLNLI